MATWRKPLFSVGDQVEMMVSADEWQPAIVVHRRYEWRWDGGTAVAHWVYTVLLPSARLAVSESFLRRKEGGA